MIVINAINSRGREKRAQRLFALLDPEGGFWGGEKRGAKLIGTSIVRLLFLTFVTFILAKWTHAFFLLDGILI